MAADEATARWASEPNPYFQLNSPFLPLVLAPKDIPMVLSPEEALQAPEVALLSLSVHAGGPRGADMAAAALKVAEQWGQVYKVICVALLKQLLDPDQRRLLEVRLGMDLDNWFRNNPDQLIRVLDLQDWFRNQKDEVARLSFERGEAKGEARALLQVLQGRGLAVTDTERLRILNCQDGPTLDRWLLRALNALSTAEVFTE